ncbi:dolichol-P-glucose synthetase [Bacteroidia bacterium]|nr:dolichol-P-glucose synthetase [Bacteroidia bacterium]GHT80452.1 dolichol-P-glucose synthetase [Bacteroidia bacterium]
MTQTELTILMPCLNEAETLEVCIKKAKGFLEKNNIAGEVLIADNGSTDGSREIAKTNGAIVVAVEERGYGAALMGGVKAAQGRYIIMGDADDSYDFANLMPFVEKLREGYELVMGNRFKGGVAKGAMPALHRYLGNPVLSGLGRLFYRSHIGDFHCGLRGFQKEAIEKLNLHTTGMEYASEMVVKATLHQLKIAEVPTTLSPDGRTRPPHLRSWRDGWRHLKFLLVHSPRWLFLYPGAFLFVVGLIMMCILSQGSLRIGNSGLDINALLYSAMSVFLGLQLMSFAVFSKLYSISIGLFPNDSRFVKMLSKFSLERGLISGAILVAIGIATMFYALFYWEQRAFGALVASEIMRITIPSMVSIVCGVQIVFSSFYLYTIEIKQHKK